jgi:GT2 family glycosyltransferase
MATKITISIVTAGFNAAKTIKDCVESVKNQTYPVQQVVVDSSSLDGTPELAPKHGCPDATIISEPEPCKVDWGSGSSLLFRTSLFPWPVSYDERFFLYFEDVDFCAQIWKAGSSVEFHPRFICQHAAALASHKSPYFLALHIRSCLKIILNIAVFPRGGI